MEYLDLENYIHNVPNAGFKALYCGNVKPNISLGD